MRRFIKAFSLLEIAIVLVIVSVVGGALLKIIPVVTNSDLEKQNKTKIEEINLAIKTFVALNAHLPCPADILSPPSTSDFGISGNCATGVSDVQIGTTEYYVRYGMVPVRALGLPDSYAFDPWGYRYEMAALRELAISSKNFNSFQTDFPATGLDQAIIIQDSSGNSVSPPSTSEPSVNNAVVYVIRSAGVNNNGAVPFEGAVSLPSCPASSLLDDENCSQNNTFRDTFFSTASSNYFDDYIAWKTYNQIRIEAGLFNSAASNSMPNIDAARMLYRYDGISAVNNTLGISSINGVSANTWVARSYNISEANFSSRPIVLSSPETGEFTLTSGKYLITAQAYFRNDTTTNVALRIFNVTDNSAVNNNPNVLSYNPNTDNYIETQGYVNINTTKTFRIEQTFSAINANTRFSNNYAVGPGLPPSTSQRAYFSITVTRLQQF